MPAKPQPTLTDRLLRYGAIASTVTAGGILSTPQAFAGATVRDINVTIDNIGGDNDDYYFDFDDDGDIEADLFMFEGVSSFMPPLVIDTSFVWLSQSSHNGDKLLSVVYAGAASSAAVLNYGDPINASAPWHAGDATLHHKGGLMSGNWGNWNFPEGDATDSTLGAYLGVKLQLDGAGPYYGWIELYYPDREHITIKRIGYGDVTGQGLPADVQLADARGVGGVRIALAGAFTALGGVLAWLRRRQRKISTQSR